MRHVAQVHMGGLAAGAVAVLTGIADWFGRGRDELARVVPAVQNDCELALHSVVSHSYYLYSVERDRFMAV